MKPRTDDEKQLVLRRLIKDLARLRTDAGNLDLAMCSPLSSLRLRTKRGNS
jgi:hypothetical protein